MNALNAAIHEAENQRLAATIKAVLFFFVGCAWMAIYGKLTAGTAVLLAFSCLVWRYTWAQYRMNKWSAKRLQEIDVEFPKSKAGDG